MKKRSAYYFLTGIAVCCLAACSGKPEGLEGQKNGTGEKLTVTALYYTELPEFEALAESSFKDIDLQIEQESVSAYNGVTLQRLKEGQGQDLVFTSMPRGEAGEYVLDLSANAFSADFTSSTMDLIRRGGKTIWLPMPGVYKGLIVNRTLARELGKDVPESLQELKALMKAAKEAGAGADENGFTFGAAEMDELSVGEMILGTMIPDFLGTMEGEWWANDFLGKKADAKGILEEPLSLFFSLASEGYMDPVCIYKGMAQESIAPAAERMVLRELSVCSGNSDTLHRIRESGTEDEFVMIPFLSGAGHPPWVTTAPASYLGVNRALAEDEKKLDAALRLLELFASPEGQAAVLRDTRASMSYLNEPVEGSGAENTGLERYVEEGYVYNTNRFYADMTGLLGSSMVRVSMGGTELSEALSSIDSLNKNRTGHNTGAEE